MIAPAVAPSMTAPVETDEPQVRVVLQVCGDSAVNGDSDFMGELAKAAVD